MELGAFTAFPTSSRFASGSASCSRNLRRASHRTATSASAASRVTCRTASRGSCAHVLGKTDGVLAEVDKLLDAQPHLPRPHGRHRHHQPQDDCAATGFTGPDARARRGVAYDVRKDHPYLVYDRLRLRRAGRHGRRQLRPLPRAHRGDARSRCASSSRRSSRSRPVRSMRRRPAHRPAAQDASLQLHRGHDQPLQAHHGRHPRARPARSTRSPRAATASSASTSSPTEPAAPGSAGVRPAVLRQHRQPSKLLVGLLIADIVPTFGMVNMIGGECDR